jgi:hypothetical protein
MIKIYYNNFFITVLLTPSLLFTMLMLESCTLGQSEYEKLIGKVREEKINDEKIGKVALFYDGFVEPRFPVTELNESSVGGIDSNHDGVRDDIEIWINRTAESNEIRKAFKDYYRKEISMYAVLESGQDENAYKASIDALGLAGFCLFEATLIVEKKYREEYGKDVGAIYSDWLDILFQNSTYRKQIYKKSQSHPIKGVLHSEKDDLIRNCENTIGQEEYAKVRKLGKNYFKK